MIGLSLLLVIFCFPETKWDRSAAAQLLANQQKLSDSNEKVDTNSQPAKTSKPTNNEIEHVPTSTSANLENGLTVSETAARDPYLGKGTPGKFQWRLFQPNKHPFKSIFLDLWIPWKLFAFPIVEFAAFVVSWSCSSFLAINLTQSQALAAPPYNWTPLEVGFTNFAILAGALIGLATAGPFSDWVSDYATRRNKGIREPEMRLVAMIPYVIIMYLGNIVVAVGYQKHWPWQAIVIVGFGAAGLQVAALPSIASTYAVDSYKPVAGSLFVAITVNKNVWGYGFSEFITDWSMKDG